MATIAVFTADPVIVPSLAKVAARIGAGVTAHREVHDDLPGEPPLAVVADLELVASIDAAAGWRARWPDALIAAFISVPDRRLWDEALARGFDLVATRGALPIQLERRLATWRGRPRGRRLRLFAAGDVAGRIGCVHRLADEVAGPIAVYHAGGEIFATADVCPHAGGQLSQGTLDRTTITCPLHGSQFDVRTGERLRGPADDAIRAYEVRVEGGIAYLMLD